MIAVELVVALVLQLCPNPEALGYEIQGEQTNCMEYYTNDIINNPAKYSKELENVKTK